MQQGGYKRLTAKCGLTELWGGQHVVYKGANRGGKRRELKGLYLGMIPK